MTDRKAANKELARLVRREKEEDLNPKEKARVEEKIKACRVNVNYTMYYPLTEKYLSIYPKSNGKPEAAAPGSEKEPSDESTTKTAKPALWNVVAKCMEDNTLNLLREGKLNMNYKGEKIQTASSTAATTETSKDKSKKKDHKEDSKAGSRKDKSASRDKSSKKEKSSREKNDVPQPTAEDDESDGGFFE